ncbi:MAG TPA: ATP-binding cassette domain-containing protein [Terriglobia bacterium]|jgi:phospholipid/cholesterol/gamma-HCH transport system ATP-binding protein|nr:ATP-binding cassette domain-containing protein [Terriglobia bacterium]
MNNPPDIQFQGVSLSFEEKVVLSEVSFQVARGETLVLLGVTGSGKSLILKLTLGLIKPDSGRILIGGEDIVPLPEERLHTFRRRMGIVFQEGALFDSLSVFENVAYRLREEGVTDETLLERQVREVLRFVEMEDAIDKMPAELSGGMRRRVSIARAIISKPSIMLYDSPTAGLDPVTAHTINVLITKLRDTQRVTSMVVTHRLQDAFVLANFVFSPDQQGIVPLRTDGKEAPSAPTKFMVLKEGSVYFTGNESQFSGSRDPYLRKFLV